MRENTTAAGAPLYDLRLGRWQDVLADVECDSLIGDPPYSARTHEGQRTGSSIRVSTIGYASIVEDDAQEIAKSWAPRVRWWVVLFGDHTTWAWHERAWREAGFCTFAPVLWMRKNPTPRMAGDGPCLAAEFIMVARRRARLRKTDYGSRPGEYRVDIGSDRKGRDVVIAGAKCINGMRAVVRDYSRPNDLVADAWCGSGTTPDACVVEGRRVVTCEVLPAHHDVAAARLARGFTPSMFAGAP